MKIFILLFFTCLSSWKAHTSSVGGNIQVTEIDFDKPFYSSTLPKGERFFRVFKDTLLLDIDFTTNSEPPRGDLKENIKRWESKLGGLKNNSSNTVRTIKSQLVLNERLKIGQELSFTSSIDRNIKNYKIPAQLSIKLLQNPFDVPELFFISYNIILSKGAPISDAFPFNEYDGIAFSGKSLRLKYSALQDLEYKEIPNEVIGSKLKNYYFKVLYPGKNFDVKVGIVDIEGSKIYVLLGKSTEASYFLQAGPEIFFHWKRPKTEFRYLGMFGKLIEGAVLTAVFESSGVGYLIIFYKDKVVKYPLYQIENYMG